MAMEIIRPPIRKRRVNPNDEDESGASQADKNGDDDDDDDDAEGPKKGSSTTTVILIYSSFRVGSDYEGCVIEKSWTPFEESPQREADRN